MHPTHKHIPCTPRGRGWLVHTMRYTLCRRLRPDPQPISPPSAPRTTHPTFPTRRCSPCGRVRSCSHASKYPDVEHALARAACVHGSLPVCPPGGLLTHALLLQGGRRRPGSGQRRMDSAMPVALQRGRVLTRHTTACAVFELAVGLHLVPATGTTNN